MPFAKSFVSQQWLQTTLMQKLQYLELVTKLTLFGVILFFRISTRRNFKSSLHMQSRQAFHNQLDSHSFTES